MLQEAGNEAFAAGAFSEAVAHYSRALREQPQDAVLLSNRAACYLAMKWQAPVKSNVIMIWCIYCATLEGAAEQLYFCKTSVCCTSEVQAK